MVKVLLIYLILYQVRIEQVIVAEPGAVLLYKLSNLLKFYHHTIRYKCQDLSSLYDLYFKVNLFF